jgi:hypothetical protein
LATVPVAAVADIAADEDTTPGSGSSQALDGCHATEFDAMLAAESTRGLGQ